MSTGIQCITCAMWLAGSLLYSSGVINAADTPATTSASQQPQDVPAAGDGNSASAFPLMAWDYAKDEATLQSMQECGINAVAFVPPNMLDACQRHSLRAIVFDERVSGGDWSKPFDADQACQNLPALIQQVNSHPAVYGYHLKDEPGAGEYPALAAACARVKELAPGK